AEGAANLSGGGPLSFLPSPRGERGEETQVPDNLPRPSQIALCDRCSHGYPWLVYCLPRALVQTPLDRPQGTVFLLPVTDPEARSATRSAIRTMVPTGTEPARSSQCEDTILPSVATPNVPGLIASGASS